MIINPIQAITEGWITCPDCTNDIRDWEDRKLLSPNAIDFTLDTLYDIENTDFHLSETFKRHRITQQQVLGDDQPFVINANSIVDFASSMYVSLPAGVCAWLIVRSTLNRNGLFITSGLYDQGFTGHVAGILHNRSGGKAYIDRGTRIGQIVFASADNSGVMYAGGYNTTVGQHWTQKQ